MPVKTEKERRLQTIIMRLLRDGRVHTHELSQDLNVTEVAIRSDFDEIETILKAHSLSLIRVWGGAELAREDHPFHGFYEGASSAEMDAIQMLSAYVAETCIKNWDKPLLLDAGRTIDLVARQVVVQGKTGLRVITNSYAPHVLALCSYGGVEFAQLGGIPVARSFCYVDCPDGDEFYQYCWAGPFKAILSGAGFGLDAGLMVNNPKIIEMKQRFIKVADEVIVVLDHTKFGKTARGTVTFCGLKPDPWLIDHAAGRHAAGHDQGKTGLPLTLVTDIPPGKKAGDLELSRALTPHADGKVCVYKTMIPLV
ncbi:MAG: DeoR/GlpR transcriptional regulator [Candidatus Latescibacteria bacterium]|nr:DeoR/GlpR transcriptional regulator [Candidatus Latescibacterota bacterium]